jgi:hypothetical protein
MNHILADGSQLLRQTGVQVFYNFSIAFHVTSLFDDFLQNTS